MEDLINRLSVSLVGVLASWGLMDISLILASLASLATLIHATLSIINILKK
tara:strand:- start:418 stop:570 length:153 start_codon:yes stop_codon:yes gene_type:complete